MLTREQIAQLKGDGPANWLQALCDQAEAAIELWEACLAALGRLKPRKDYHTVEMLKHAMQQVEQIGITKEKPC
jgi:hypothetical protein